MPYPKDERKWGRSLQLGNMLYYFAECVKDVSIEDM